jgi:putative tryptophan/tyrosine transport system substrate-binding protein
MIGRRDILAGFALAFAPRALAQQTTQRRMGWLSPRSQRTERDLTPGRRGLDQMGFVEGRNLMIDYRYADGDFSRLPGLAADLLGLRPEVVVTTGGAQPARAVRALSAGVPIVFASGNDPLRDGLVESFGRPGGNTTGVWTHTAFLGPKRLELLREIAPQAYEIAFLVNPHSNTAAAQEREMTEAARAASQAIAIFRAGAAGELDAAFAAMAERRVGALLMSADTFFQVERDRLVALAARHALPTMFEWSEFAQAGGLMSYAAAIDDTWFYLGSYAGRILKGENPGGLPVVQSATFVLTLNLKTAKAQGIVFPPTLLARADDVIE